MTYATEAAPASAGQPPAVLLGGLANTTAVARALGRQGVRVVVLADRNSAALHSKYAEPHPRPDQLSPLRFYHRKLLEDSVFPRGTVLFPCEDTAIDFVARHHRALQRRYRLDLQNPQHQMQLLDKQKTLALARQAGLDAPRSWRVATLKDVEALLDELEFPVLIKPIHSHRFQEIFKRKLLYIQGGRELLLRSRDVLGAGLRFMLCEFIPGPDHQLSSYYVYLDRQGKPLFQFTKRVLRRSPPNFGAGSYHITQWLPETAALGQRFFTAMNFRGLGNIEFKRDPRDQRLKVIECNARFTGAQALITRSGLNMPWLIYRYLAYASTGAEASFREFMTLWLPFEDFDAFRDLRAARELSPAAWLRSVCRRQVFCYLDWDDPKPFLKATRRELKQRLQWLLHNDVEHRRSPAL